MSKINKNCELCKKPLKYSIVELSCGHKFCPDCIKQDLSDQIKETPENEISLHCSVRGCKTVLNEQILEEILDSKIMKTIKKKKTCEKCKKSELTIMISCGHRFCKICLQDEIRDQIGKNKLVCFCCIICSKEEKKMDKIIDFLGYDWMSKYFAKCNGNCEKFIPKNFLKELICGHRMCKECKELCIVEKNRKCCLKCNKNLSQDNNAEQEKCKFCKKYLKNSRIIKFECKHKICRPCFRKYLKKFQTSEVDIFCPKFDCDIKLSQETLKPFFKDEKNQEAKLILNKSPENIEKIQKFKKVEEEEKEKKEEKKVEEKTEFLENIKNGVYLGNGKNIKENKLENSSPNNNFSPIEDKTPNRDSINRITCSLCDLLKSTTTSNVIRFDCGHDFCLKCLYFRINETCKVSKDYSTILQCPSQFCHSVLDINKLKPFLNEKIIKYLENLNKTPLIKNNISNDPRINDKPINIKQMKSEEEKIDNFQKTKLIQCGKCKIEISTADIITLSCEHKFCKHCMKEEWEAEIKSCHDLKCLTCSTEIDFPIIKHNLSEDLLQKYDKYLLEKVMYASTPRNNENKHFGFENKSENILYCPKCHKNPLAKSLSSTYPGCYCDICKEFFCEKCLGSNEYHSGKTCEEYKQILEKDFRCPKCRKLIAIGRMDDKYSFCGKCILYICLKCNKEYQNFNHQCSL